VIPLVEDEPLKFKVVFALCHEPLSIPSVAVIVGVAGVPLSSFATYNVSLLHVPAPLHALK